MSLSAGQEAQIASFLKRQQAYVVEGIGRPIQALRTHLDPLIRRKEIAQAAPPNMILGTTIESGADVTGLTQPTTGFGYWDARNVTNVSGYASVLLDALGSNNITQTTAGSRAQIQATAGAGGGPALYFDGGDEYRLSYTRILPVSRIAVVRCTSVDKTFIDGGSGNRGRIYGATTTCNAYSGAILSAACTLTNWNVFRVDFDGASSRIYVNGTLISTGNTGANTPNGITIGAYGGATADKLTGWISSVWEGAQADAPAWDTYLGKLNGVYP